MRPTHSFGPSSRVAALACIATCACASKQVIDYFVQVGGEADGNDFVIATHGTGDQPQGYDPGSHQIDLFPLGGTYIPGGSTAVGLVYFDGSAPFGPPIVKVTGADGWFFLSHLRGYNGALFVTMSQHAPRAFVLRVTSSQYEPLRARPNFDDMPIQLTNVGMGDVQVNVSWDRNSVIHLHVIEPSGEELFYGHAGRSVTGGRLDLGSETDCSSAAARMENIFWPNGGAPRGSYTVRVNYSSACEPTPYRFFDGTQYVVTVNVKGQQPQVFYGRFPRADVDHGGAGSGRTITTFTY